MKAQLQIRTQDRHGSGEFGAPRKGGTHKGVDYSASPGSQILSPVAGEVTKLGYAYADDLKWRYVQITDAAGRNHRLFYLEPTVTVGDVVAVDDVLGSLQDLGKRYPQITPHCHYEIKKGNEFLNPEEIA